MNELKQPYFSEFESEGGFDDTEVVDTDTFEDEAEAEPVTETVEETKPIDEVAPYKLKVKFNHEEMEVSEEDAIMWTQKGMNADKGTERTRQEGRDAWIAEQNYVWNGKHITTEAEFRQAEIEQQVKEKYQAEGLPDEVIEELIASKKDRLERQQEKQLIEQQKQEIAQRAAIEKDAENFFNWFRTENGRNFEVGKDDMPQEIWQSHLEGNSLISEYSKHENKLIKQRLKVFEQNTKNQQKAPVNGVTSHGADKVESDVLFDGFDD